MTAPLVAAPDMHHTPDELAALDGVPALRDALGDIDANLVPAYVEADRLALSHQQSFRRITITAAVFGTTSILVSMLGMVATSPLQSSWSRLLLGLQVVCLAITAVAVLRGLFAYRHENWLLERWRAEQLRALKFDALLDPDAWSDDLQVRHVWRERLRAGVARARTLQREDLAAMSVREELPPTRSADAARLPDGALLDALVGYYDRKRLGPQRAYFFRASAHTGLGARALPLVFFVAVGLEVIQSILTGAAMVADTELLRSIGTWLGGASVAIPVIWAGFKTQQAAHEGARNANRSRARHDALTRLSERLLSHRTDAVEVMATIRLAEFLLQVDQREWLRLLRDAEWYG